MAGSDSKQARARARGDGVAAAGLPGSAPSTGAGSQTVIRPPRSLLDFVLRTAQIKTNVCSFQDGERGYTLEPRTVTDYNLIFALRGRIAWVVAGQEVALEAGDLVIVPPAVKHHAFSRTPAFTLGSLHVEVTLPGGQDVFELLLLPRALRVPAGTRLDGYLRGAFAEFSRTETAQTMLMLPPWSRLVVLELLRFCWEEQQLGYQAVDPLIAGVLDELNQRFAQEVTLAELAHCSGFSPQHLNRVFRRVLGVTPLQYLARIRMEKAAALLREGRLTVRAVGEQVGYVDPYYFSRQFRRFYRRSPVQYRLAAAGDPGNAAAVAK